MKRIGLIISQKSRGFFEELIIAFEEVLSRTDYSIIQLPRIPNPGEFDYVIVFGVHEFPPPPFSTETKYIGIQTEQLPQIGYPITQFQYNNFNHIQLLFEKYYHIFDLYEGNLNYLTQKGIKNCSLFKVGYHRLFDLNKSSSEKYDIAFVGYLSSRRKSLLNKLRTKYTIRELQGIFGEARNNLLLESKICLNIHTSESDFFERVRIDTLFISKKLFVLSEESLYYDPYIPNEHLIFRNIQNIEAAIDYYLKNDLVRRKIAEAGYNYIREHNLFSNNMRESLNKIGLII